MKKVLIAIIVAASLTSLGGEVIREITYTSSDLTVVGALTNSVTFTARSDRLTYPLGVYQSVSTQTNTCVLTQTMGDASTAVQVESLSAVANTTSYETVGMGDVSADIDDIVVLPEEQLILTGTGADSTNVTYVLVVKEVDM